ncbi:hypothetical protein AWM68_06955 [Fictibacillus phosphorivorans]|uniref:Uncharacterized protein n=1 Tax=Fictibacillus phosphorivorans TaxID=1221500 RepID=A0A163R300_9BACL|nr:hypothetical protein [Fictibacillus phosphorivorans]KZE66109.1 hypothetical protein AWM68_06955 [Fictibacillus phosphorivorans]
MLKMVSILCTFVSGSLLFFAWSGYLEKEFEVDEYRGYVIEKKNIELTNDIGTFLVTQPSHKIKFSDGTELVVPYSIYKKIKENHYTVIIKQKDNMTILK